MKALGTLGIMVCILVGQAQADLTTIGTATYGGSDYNLIWDDDNNGNSVVWLDYTNGYANWQDHKDWASGLNVGGVLTYNIDPGYAVTWNGDWRLPITPNVDTSQDYNRTDSEMGHLYYTELGNVKNGASTTIAPFENLTANPYWSDTPAGANAWVFSFDSGGQFKLGKGWGDYGLAIRSAEVVPVPGAVLLGMIGLSLAGVKLRRRA